MKKMNQFLFSILFFISLLSISFSDVTSSITSLVGRNAEGYLAPIGTMMGTGMNSGFYRKASPHKILGFDITVDFAYAMAPAGQTTYKFVIPDDSLSYAFQFQFPKSYLQTALDNTISSNEILSNIPDAKKELLDALLWGLKLEGCAISEKEIRLINKLEESKWI